jgi:[CysO sulfur-carrier protein]-S-L-cysteine hydrolase
MLSEPQIQRYARQLLLREVGGGGQEALGRVGVRLEGTGPLLASAAAYLRAGGTPVEHLAPSHSAWVVAPALVQGPPDRWLAVIRAPATLSGEGLIVGAQGAATSMWSAGGEACGECLAGLVGGLRTASVRGPAALLAGSLAALLLQRRALGLAPALEGISIVEGGSPRVLAAPVCSHRPPRVTAEVLARVVAHLTSVWPEEGCGVLLAGDHGVRVVPLPNAQAAHRARDPAAFPRDAQAAFVFEPRTWLGLLREAESSGERVLAVFHSHPDGPARFSAEDRRQAAPGGIPLLPGVAHLVVAFHRGRPEGATWALWKNSEFVEHSCALPMEDPEKSKD